MKTETECEIELIAAFADGGVAAHYQDSAYKKNGFVHYVVGK